MRGGVTSGIVYPPALCRLASKYVVKNIGGTSVGALAAAATAAAEWRRRTDANPQTAGRGYVELAKLAEFLKGDGTLRALFAADRPARALLDIALNLTGNGAMWSKAARTIGAAVRVFWWLAVVVFVVSIGAFAVVARPNAWEAGIACIIAGLVLGAPATLIALLAWYLIRFGNVMRSNDFGWCHGFGASAAEFQSLVTSGADVAALPKEQVPPLTDWLDAFIAQVAGRDRKVPLTFGDLWSAPEPQWHVADRFPHDERGIDFRMITTCLTLGRPLELPFPPNEHISEFPEPATDRDGDGLLRPPLYFEENELGRYFPEHIIRHLKTHGALSAKDPRYFRMPAAEKMPLIVAARLSMSFPVLFCALPLHALDENGTMWPIWFSDGGLSSNFPIHLFDAPLPRWPTFAINLVGGDPSRKKAIRNTNRDDGRVFLESDSPHTGTITPWTTLGEPGDGAPLSFGGAIIETMRNWQDNTLGTLPANRNRTVAIRLSADEGGLNLTMGRDKIEALMQRGDKAGNLLTQHFSPAPDAPAWQEHRWTRYRAVMSALARWLRGFADGYAPFASAAGQIPYERMIPTFVSGAGAPVARWLWSDSAQAQNALNATESVARERTSWSEAPHHDPCFETNDPEPIASLRMRPDVRYEKAAATATAPRSKAE
jgi:predicted acylesterase/phospholipase RssA